MPCNVFADEELERLARERLNEVPERREKDVEAIREWIRKEPHLGENARQDDAFILNNLRGSKFSLERAKEKIDAWHAVRTHAPDLFEGWDPRDPANRELLELGVNVYLEGYDAQGRRVAIVRSAAASKMVKDPATAYKVVLMVHDMICKNDLFQAAVNGVVLIYDMKGVGFEYVKNMCPAFARKLQTILKEAYPMSPKEIHAINVPPVAVKVVNMALAIGPEKFRKRAKIHAEGGDLTRLQEALGREVLPEEYGGDAGPLRKQVERTHEEALANRDWLIQLTKYKSEEKKRLGKQVLYSDLFGMEGSFRKLQID